MPLTIKNAEADALARELTALTGETLTEAVVRALRERLEHYRRAGEPASLRDELMSIGRRCASLAVQDPRGTDEILGYDDAGLPR